MPKYSFIIPVYQTHNYLSKCVDSLLNQTYDNFEIILVDDGSNDGSEHICDLYSKKDNRVVSVHKKNEGISIARNLGLQIAKGEYVIFVDSDDYWLNNNSLMEINNIIDSCDVVFYDLTVISNKNVDLGVTRNLNDRYDNGKEFIINLLNNNYSFPWFAFLYVVKKEVMMNNHIEFPKNSYFEDKGTMYKILLSANKIAVLKKSVYAYIKTNSNSVTKNVNIKLLKDHLTVSKNAIVHVESLNLDDTITSLLCNNMACGYIDIMNHMYMLPKEKYTEMIGTMKDNLHLIKYLKYGKQKYMAIIIKLFGIKISSILFGAIHRTKNSVI